MTSVTSHLAPLTNAYHAWIEEIEPNPFQPRVYFDEAALKELADSVKADGVLQPILLRPVPDSDLRHKSKRKAGIKFQIVFGERRWRASKLAGLAQIPAIIREDIDDIRAREIALDENIKQESLTDFEEAKALQDLWQAYEEQGQPISQNQMAKRRKVSVTFVRNRVQLLLTKPDVQAVASKHRGVISSCLLINPISDEDLRKKLLGEVERGASFRNIEAAIEKAKAEAAWKRDSQRAPDKETRAASNPARRKEALAQVKESLREADRQIANALAWQDEINRKAWEQDIMPLLSRLCDKLTRFGH